MATHQVTRPHPNQPQPLPKSTVYFTVASLNRELEFAVEHLGKLREFKFRREPIDAIIAKIEELRCWSNSEFLEVQVEREEKEINRWETLSRRPPLGMKSLYSFGHLKLQLQMTVKAKRW